MMELKLDCTRCNVFTDYWEEKKNMVRCNECGKRHHIDSVWMVKPGKEYKRDRDGTLLETPI